MAAREQVVEELAELRARIEEREAGMDDPAELELQLEQARSERARLERYRDAARMAREELAAAAREAHQRVAPHLNAALARELPRITRGRYHEAMVGDDLSIRVVAPGSGEVVDVERLSRGTRDQVALIERLELARLLDPTGGGAPLLLDDCFAHTDEHRLPLALELLAEVAEHRQVILFTSDRDVVDAVRAADGAATIIELPDPGRSGHARVARAVPEPPQRLPRLRAPHLARPARGERSTRTSGRRATRGRPAARARARARGARARRPPRAGPARGRDRGRPKPRRARGGDRASDPRRRGRDLPGLLSTRRVGRLRGLPGSRRRAALHARAVLLRGPRRQARARQPPGLRVPAALLRPRADAHPGRAAAVDASRARRRRPAQLPARGVRRLRRARARALRRAARRAGRRQWRDADLSIQSRALPVLPLVEALRGPPPRGRSRLAGREREPHAGGQARGRGRWHRRIARPASSGHAGSQARERDAGRDAAAGLAAAREPPPAGAQPHAARARARPRPAPAPAAVRRRSVLRLRGRPVVGRRGPRVPLRDRPARGRCVALRRPLGHDSRRGEGELRGVDRLGDGAAGAPPRPARLPLQRLRADRSQAARRAPRHARGRGRRAAAPARLRRPLRDRAPGLAHRRRVLRAQRARARARLRALSRPGLAARLVGVPGDGRPFAAGRDRRLQRGGLPLDAVAAGLAAQSARRRRAPVRHRARRARPGAARAAERPSAVAISTGSRACASR